jgi:hypothetical protein
MQRHQRKMRPYGLVALHRYCSCPVCQDTLRVSRAAQKRWDAYLIDEQLWAEAEYRSAERLLRMVERARAALERERFFERWLAMDDYFREPGEP